MGFSVKLSAIRVVRVQKKKLRNSLLQRNFPDLFKVDIEQIFRFHFCFGIFHHPRADSAVTVGSVGAVTAFRGVNS